MQRIDVYVHWGLTGLTLENLEVTEPSEIYWQTDPEQTFNIVGVFGLNHEVFSFPIAYKPAEQSTLQWFVGDLCLEEGTYSYSILAVKDGDIRFHDPKITNMPSPPETPPPENELG